MKKNEKNSASPTKWSGLRPGAEFTKCSTILLRLFLLQFFPTPIRMHQIFSNKEELYKNCGKIVARFCICAMTVGGGEELYKNCRNIFGRARAKSFLPLDSPRETRPKVRARKRLFVSDLDVVFNMKKR
jgi:hypothetical protein